MHHMRPEKDFLCPMCSFKTTQEYYLRRHVKRVHAKIKEFSCQICPYKSSQKADVARDELYKNRSSGKTDSQ